METQFELVLLLLAIAAGVTAFAKKLNLPYPIALVIVGAIIGLLPIPGLEELKDFFAEDEVFRFAIISIFLPTLLGEATLKLPFSHLRENRGPILTLALVGTLVSFIVAGLLTVQFLSLPLQAAFVFAALMAATDPVSVLSIFKSMGVNHRLSIIMEGESLINDGVAVVLFTIAAYQMSTFIEAGPFGIAMGLFQFFKVVIGGLLIGGLLAYFFSKLTRFFDDYPLEIIFSMLLFYGAFFISEAFHVSGVIAVVIAGLIFGNYGARIGMSPTTKLNIKNFWDVAALVANSLVFLMVGLEIMRISLWDKWMYIIGAILIVLASRSIAVYTSVGFIRHIPRAWKHVFNWGGLKGSLSIALAFSLPSSFPMREEVLVLAFGVVLFSLIVQGLTIKPLVSWLGVQTGGAALSSYETILSRIYRYTSGKKRLEKMKDEGTLSPVIFRQLGGKYEEQLNDLHHQLNHLYQQNPEIQKEQMERAIKEALYAEHEAVDHLSSHHLISDQVSDEQRKEIIELLEQEKEK
ncbi:Na+/H+ antiporter [Microaerobacter geothermalis]|uniref:Na+/H+ antiporter n=1 Tax=Microaerobacter geothermalis TaxID=674972 RepID=UPI001F3E1264|nr:Na+/H+ antiporter [Microaerobacter geothermalis]MCF6092612.1 Na+/H+ antiporter [Microaerobacter geothermalis]